jgi:hypothetical protein
VSNGTRSPEKARIKKLEERMNDMIHLADLQVLVDNWRHNSERRSSSSVDTDTLDQCADELEALIDGREVSDSGDTDP